MPTQKPAPRVRQATHAGSWYSHEEQALNTELTEWLRSASEENAHGQHQAIRAIIAPHAGFRYSGPTAAHAYHHLEALERVKRVFILGPSHHFYLRGCAVSTAVEYETPLGNIEIDNEINEQLINTGKFVTMSLDVDEDEHSIEMHLPFIFKVMNGRKFTAVPILVGNTKAKMDQEYGKILAPYLEDEENLFVISSDFCHWGSRFRYQPHDSAYGEIHEYIKYLDHEGMKLIERIDATGFAEYLEKTKNTICGRHPISLLLHSIRASDKLRCTLKFVQYAQSSACKHHGDSSMRARGRSDFNVVTQDWNFVAASVATSSTLHQRALDPATHPRDMLKSRRASSMSSSASASTNPAITSTIGGGSTITLDRSATSTLSFRNLGTVATMSVKEKKNEKDRPAWKRLTRKISQTLSGSSKKKNKGGMLMLTAPPTVNEDERSVSKKEKHLAAETATPSIALVQVSLSKINASTQVQYAAEYRSNADDPVIDSAMTENASEGAEETDQGGDTRTLSSVEELPQPSSQFLALIDSIPVDFPLIRYIAECLLTDQVPPPIVSAALPPSGDGNEEQQQCTKDVESQLFFKCLELEKWALAQTLAEKMQRRVAFQYQYHHQQQRKSGSHSSNEVSEAHTERIHSGSSAITEEEALDAHDVVLSFLETCSS